MSRMATDPAPKTVREAQRVLELEAILTHMPEVREAAARARAQQEAGWPEQTWSADEVDAERTPSPPDLT